MQNHSIIRVKRLRGSAQGTAMRLTPCSGQAVLGVREQTRVFIWQVSRCRQRRGGAWSCRRLSTPHSGQGAILPVKTTSRRTSSASTSSSTPATCHGDSRPYLEWIRWPEGFVCPQCGGSDAWRTKRGLWHSQSCRHQASVTAGTLFADSRKSLRLWFHVMWLMMAQKTGLSAKNLCETYGFGSYQTAWAWLQKLRGATIRRRRERLRGRVEVDEAYVGGQRDGRRGRGAEGKTRVLVAVEAAPSSATPPPADSDSFPVAAAGIAFAAPSA